MGKCNKDILEKQIISVKNTLSTKESDSSVIDTLSYDDNLPQSKYPNTFQSHVSTEQAIKNFNSRVGEWHTLAQLTIFAESEVKHD
jgi:hypothetical protein